MFKILFFIILFCFVNLKHSSGMNSFVVVPGIPLVNSQIQSIHDTVNDIDCDQQLDLFSNARSNRELWALKRAMKFSKFKLL
jgi:hypothetical protein